MALASLTRRPISGSGPTLASPRRPDRTTRRATLMAPATRATIKAIAAPAGRRAGPPGATAAPPISGAQRHLAMVQARAARPGVPS